MRFVRLVSMLIITLFSLQAMPVQAEEQQNILSFEELKVQVMPEFSHHPKDKDQDKPTLLVGYHGSLMNQSAEPQKGKIEIPLPTKAKNFRIGFVADYNRDGTEMLEIEYELDKKTGLISWETHDEIQPGELYKFVIEYYTDEIVAKDEKKTLTYTFKSFADTGIVTLTFLEPLKTESFGIKPETEQHQQNPYGMNMFMYQLSGLKANEEKTYKITYSRAEKTPTMTLINEMAGEASKGEAPVKKNETLSTPLIVGVVTGTSTVLGSLLLFFMRRKKKPNQKQRTATLQPTEEKKQRLRSMLLEGKISEEEYNELIKRLGA